MTTHIHHDIPKLERVTNSDGSRLYKTPSGSAYPSVTTITGLHKKQAIMEWRKRVGEEKANAISSKAAKRGTAIHKICEDFLNNEFVEPHLVDVPMWNSLVPLLSRIDNVHCLETPLYSDHLQVAGTVDCIAEFDGKVSVIDFKTSTRVKTKDSISNYFMQCAAYGKMFEEHYNITPKKIVIIMGVPNAPFPLRFVEPYAPWIDKLQTFLKENP
jgi:genome maintenance exonuclease 1